MEVKIFFCMMIMMKPEMFFPKNVLSRNVLSRNVLSRNALSRNVREAFKKKSKISDIVTKGRVGWAPKTYF